MRSGGAEAGFGKRGPQGTRRRERGPTRFHTVRHSLCDLLGEEYVASVCTARSILSGMRSAEVLQRAGEPVDFFPQALHARLTALLPRVGQRCCPPAGPSAVGATSDAFRSNTQTALAPRSCLGYLRIGEDGRLFLSSKSAHYHAPLGHDFPGYALIERARGLGIGNATHNNTRGHITRLVEEELVRHAAGLQGTAGAALSSLLASRDAAALNRVLNLETGSLAVEAAVKMVLSRFYRIDAFSQEPRHAGRTPVLLVMGDDAGGLGANYHGTTMVTQAMRGMWPEMVRRLESEGVLAVRSVRCNNVAELEAAFRDYDREPYKIAGFFHELLLMNYGGTRLSAAFAQRAYALCARHGVPTIVDEIQSGIWSPELFMFREYGLKPSAVIVGKGFPGGEYAASRILFSADMDSLPQFGALVTNGQQELASLAYLVTMRWATANAAVTRAAGDYYEERLKDLAERYSHLITKIEGRRHSAGVYFDGLDAAKAFVAQLRRMGLDISVQTYKEGCPPSALTKLPLICGYEAMDEVVARMEAALNAI